MAKSWARMSTEEKLESLADTIDENTAHIEKLRNKATKYEEILHALSLRVAELEKKDQE